MPRSKKRSADSKREASTRPRAGPVDEDAIIDEAIRLAKDEAKRLASERAEREARVLEEARRKAEAVLGEAVADEHLASKTVMRPPKVSAVTKKAVRPDLSAAAATPKGHATTN